MNIIFPSNRYLSIMSGTSNLLISKLIIKIMQNHSRIYKILPKIIGVKVYFSKPIVLALDTDFGTCWFE
jgi:hypothetical protein